jgi:hypothetical protein
VETYIVRLYRQSSLEPAGTVERVRSGDRIGFAGREQLLECLLDRDWKESATPSIPISADGDDAAKNEP